MWDFQLTGGLGLGGEYQLLARCPFCSKVATLEIDSIEDVLEVIREYDLYPTCRDVCKTNSAFALPLNV